MSFRTRNLARLCAATALAAGATGLFAAPALAADSSADLSLKLTGTTISAGTSGGKGAIVSFKNDGPSAAKNWWFEADLSKLDTSKVEIPTLDGCTVEGDLVGCYYEDKTDLGAGESWEDIFQLVKKDGATGDAGSVTLSVKSETADPNEGNNTVTVPVTITETEGPDLQVIAPDVTGEDGGPIAAGGDSVAIAYVNNAGTHSVTGLKIDLTLPKGASFTEDGKFSDCTYSGQTVSCELTDGFLLIPADKDAEGDEYYSSWVFGFPVSVAKDAQGPALKGGVANAEATDFTEYRDPATLRAATVPDTRKVECGKPVEESALPGEIDASDNSDDFVVLVAGEGGTGGGGGEDDPTLPVTGTQVGVIGGVGAAAAAAGIAMFLVARRRRVVTVTPGDEN